jgi:hypothetical protein
MAKGPERLTRWILGHTQPKKYSLSIDHLAMEDIAWAADEIETLSSRLDTERRELDVADEKNLRLQGELKAANDAWHEQEDELRALRAGYAELLAINVQQGDQLHAMESRLGSVQNALRRLLGALPAEWRTPVGHDADCRCVQHEAFAAVDNRWGIDSQYPSAVEIPVRKSE